MKKSLKSLISSGLGKYFSLMSDKEDEQVVKEQVSAGVVFRGTNLWILMFAILIASLGLNVNSTAVIISAMLISPLMGPIIGMGLSVGIRDVDLLKKSLKNYGVATLISIVTATVYFILSPLGEARSELLARTSPSLYDVLIAFFGGAAGVLALTTKNKGQVIPGVAIATALMPPLCTAGYGLATLQWNYFFGAFYLFFINTVFIALSTFIGVKLLKFRKVNTINSGRLQYAHRVMAVVLVVILLPAGWMTYNIVKHEVRDRNVRQFVGRELSRPGTQILSSTVSHDTLSVVAVGRRLSDSEVSDAVGRMAYYKLGGMTLSLIQGTDGENLEVAAALYAVGQANAENMALMSQQVAELERQLDSYRAYDTLASHLGAEAAPIFPQVKAIHTGRVDGEPVAIVDVADSKTLPRDKFEAWLKARLNVKTLRVIYD